MKLIDKNKKTVGQNTDKVWYAPKVKKGMTKKQCRLVPDWSYSIESKSKSGSTEIWWYDDGSYLVFYKGKLTGWHY